MPTYFFHIRDSWGLIPDEEGMDFSNLYQAEAEGYASARDLAAADPSAIHDFVGCAIEVTDEDGAILSRIKVEPLCRVA